MKTKIKFQKYSGNGNDFIILDHPLTSPTPELVSILCNRHFGVGADGVLVLSDAPEADGRMQIYNADGGEAEMCGNGIRCLVTYMDDQSGHLKDHYTIKTMNGLYEVSRREGTFAIEMAEIKDKNLYDLSEFNQFNRAFYINTGVPHLVFEVVPDALKIDIKATAPHYRFHKMFPGGTNVSFLHLLEGHQQAYVRTFERGVEDETFSCGTGLTACALALKEWHNWEGNITLKTLGGSQYINLGDKVLYSGEVKFCFQGEFIL